jgi:predicted nucleic acid-binding protein
MSIRDLPRLVLDTNVGLDLWLFRDPRCLPLREAIETRRVLVVDDVRCRAEWQRVLAYPELECDAPRRAAAALSYAAWVADAASLPVGTVRPVRLPRCDDPDDQKFVEVAHAAGALALFTRDNALLALARRVKAACGFMILPPAHFGRVAARL